MWPPLQGAEGATDTRGSLRDRVPTVGAREVLLRRGASGLRVGELWPVRVLRRTVAGVLVLREATVGPQVRRHVGPRLSGLDRGRQRRVADRYLTARVVDDAILDGAVGPAAPRATQRERAGRRVAGDRAVGDQEPVGVLVRGARRGDVAVVGAAATGQGVDRAVREHRGPAAEDEVHIALDVAVDE